METSPFLSINFIETNFMLRHILIIFKMLILFYIMTSSFTGKLEN
jgi:hypothetical protein